MKLARKIYIKMRNLKGLRSVNPYKISRFLMESQYWDSAKISRYQLNGFNKLIDSAKNTPFYNLRYSNIKTELSREDIKNLAITSKEEYQLNQESFISDRGDKGFAHASSGSTGKPTKIYISTKAEAYRRATVMRFRAWWGLKAEDKLINFTAYPRPTNSLIKKVKNYLNPKLDINIFSISQANVFSIYDEIYKYKPKYFRGYVSSIKQLGLLFEEYNLDARKFNLKVIIVTSEIFYDSDREILEKIFGCKVANEYGCAEQGFIAYQCPKGGMHMQEEMILAFTNKNNEIISTELNNDLSPLINYKIGDKVIISDRKCECGRNLQLVERIEGRIGSDDILKPDGSRMNYLFFDKMIKNMSNTELWGTINRFQVIQKGTNFMIYLVKGKNYSNEVSKYILDYVKTGISNDIFVKIIFKEDIAPEKSGKYRIFKRID